jgi:hypothetical protein
MGVTVLELILDVHHAKMLDRLIGGMDHVLIVKLIVQMNQQLKIQKVFVQQVLFYMISQLYRLHGM